MLQRFSVYGKILEWCFPKDKDGTRKPFGFVTYSSEEEAAKAIKDSNGVEFSGRTLRVCYALERQSFAYVPKSPARSRSRSPVRTQVTVESDLRTQISELSRNADELKERSYKLLRDIEDLNSRYETVKTENENLYHALADRKPDTETELPCGHRKKLTAGQKHLYEGLVREVLARLHPEQRQEELFVKTLRLRTYGILEAKHSDFRCCRVLNCIIGACGHGVSETCWQMRALFLKSKPVFCSTLVQGPCHHILKVECGKADQQNVCRECFKSFYQV